MDFRKLALETGTRLKQLGLDTDEQMMQLVNTRFKPPRNGFLHISCPQCPQRFSRTKDHAEYFEYIQHWLDHIIEEKNPAQEPYGSQHAHGGDTPEGGEDDGRENSRSDPG
jgi:hypothetical protein